MQTDGLSTENRARKKRTLTLQLGGANFSYFIANAAAVGYIAVYLGSKGYSAAQIGTISAINSAISIFAAPLWGMLADRWRSTVKVILLCAGVGGVLYALVPSFEGVRIGGFPLILALIPIAQFFRQPVMSLTDSATLKISEKYGTNYGLIRAAGSLSYALASVSLGVIVPRTGSTITFYIAFAFAIPTMFCVYFAHRGEMSAKTDSVPLRELRFGELFRNFRLMSYLLLSILMCTTLYCNATFLPRLLESIGSSGERVGLVNGSKAFVEIPFLIMIPWLRKKFKLENIITVAVLLFTAESLVFTFANSFWQVLVAAILFDGVGAGLFYAASANFVFSLAPERLKSTAQALIGTMSALSGVVGNLLGGILTEAFGVQSFYLVAAILTFAAAASFFAINLATRSSRRGA